MAFEEIKAGLEKYTAEIDEEKRNAARNLSVKYIIKEHSALINDGNDLFYVYAHYPTTEPDVMVMAFVSRANAEMFCEALNAENECREADFVKHGKWDNGRYVQRCSECDYPGKKSYAYCPWCGATMDGDNNG